MQNLIRFVKFESYSLASFNDDIQFPTISNYSHETLFTETRSPDYVFTYY